jgi:dihydrodipicolinate synthase/N-acetylneuraminate lyase
MIGSVIPVLYSFYDKSDTLDLEAHEQQIAWVLAGQASGVTLLALASEGASLAPDGRKAVMQ